MLKWAIVACMFAAYSAGAAQAQVSPEEHKQHHPNEKDVGPGGGEANASGGGSGMGAGKMGEMMEQMGVPKPRDLYPSLMELPDLPVERRTEFEQQAYERMMTGSHLLGEALDELSASAARDDFEAMQVATSKLREGVSVFDSGLSAYRALRESKAPRNVALQWFKREMNLTGAVERPSADTLFWGMAPLHTGIMVVLAFFAVAMLGMYFQKMRRAAELVQKLTAATSAPVTPAPATPVAAANEPLQARPGVSEVSKGLSQDPSDDCCDPAVEDSTEESAASQLASDGLLPLVRKKFCRLRVARIVNETKDVKTFRLVACHGGGIPFSYLPGQFLTLTLPVTDTDKPIRRSYTISSSPTQGYYCEVTVKREEKGAGSRYLHDRVKVGDTLQAMEPNGRFTFSGKESDSIVLIAGGVGITPMMSVARAMTDMAWPGQIDFIVACRGPEHLIFKSELERLQAQYANFRLFVAMSGIDEDLHGYRSGRLSKEMLADWVPDIARRRVHICGPVPMMDATKAMLGSLEVPTQNIYTENFGAAAKPKAKAERVSALPETAIGSDEAIALTAAQVTFARSKQSTRMQPAETVLEAAERVGVDIAYSCRVGSCGICVTQLLSGSVSMETEDGLEPRDKEAGIILACQAKATSDIGVDA